MTVRKDMTLPTGLTIKIEVVHFDGLNPQQGLLPSPRSKDPVIGAETINQNNVREIAGKETAAYLFWFQPGQFHSGTFVSVLSGIRVLLGVAQRRG